MALALIKTIRTEPITLQTLAAGSQIYSSVIDVSSSLHARFFVDYGVLAAGSTPTPPQFEVQMSYKDTGADKWIVVLQRMCMQLNGAGAAALTAGVSAGDTTFSGAGDCWAFSSGQKWVFLHDAVFADSEWVKEISRSGSVNTIADPLTNAHAVTTTVARRGARYTYAFDLTFIRRIRVALYNNITRAGATVDHAVRVALITTDSLE